RRRQRPGVPRARARYRADDNAGTRARQRAGSAGRCLVRAVSRLRQRVHGDRDDRVGACVSGAGRGPSGPGYASAPDPGHAVRHDRVPAAGRARAGGRTPGRRAPAVHGSVRARGAGRSRRRLAGSAATRARRGAAMSEPALEARGLSHTFFPGTPNEQVALREVDLIMAPKAFVVVLGANGSGKSTLLNAIAGGLTLDEGTVRLSGRDVTGWPEG